MPLLLIVVVLAAACGYDRSACLMSAREAAWQDRQASCDVDEWDECEERERILAELRQSASQCPP